MKIAKERQTEAKNVKPKIAVNNELLKKLKELRFEIAREKKVPAFVIFSDATLVDMCSRMPANDDEFLEVSGVGRVKLEAYGEKFMEVIGSFRDSGIPQAVQQDCSMDEVCVYIKEAVELSDEPIPVSMFTDKINVLLLQKNFRKVSAQKIADYLVLEGYLEIETAEGKNAKIATARGREAGITTVLKVRYNNESYKQNLYAAAAQKLLIENIEGILRYALKI